MIKNNKKMIKNNKKGEESVFIVLFMICFIIWGIVLILSAINTDDFRKDYCKVKGFDNWETKYELIDGKNISQNINCYKIIINEKNQSIYREYSEDISIEFINKLQSELK